MKNFLKLLNQLMLKQQKMIQTQWLQQNQNANKTSPGVAMSGGKPIPVGTTAKLQGINWADLDKDAINFHYIENK